MPLFNLATPNGLAKGVESAAPSTGTGAGTKTLTVLFGSLDPSTIGTGTSFGVAISSGNELNSFFAAPPDPNGASGDIGVAVGLRDTIAAGATRRFVTDMAFGLTAPDARNAFINAQVPEPTTALFGFALTGMVGLTRRRRTA